MNALEFKRFMMEKHYADYMLFNADNLDIDFDTNDVHVIEANALHTTALIFTTSSKMTMIQQCLESIRIKPTIIEAKFEQNNAFDWKTAIDTKLTDEMIHTILTLVKVCDAVYTSTDPDEHQFYVDKTRVSLSTMIKTRYGHSNSFGGLDETKFRLASLIKMLLESSNIAEFNEKAIVSVNECKTVKIDTLIELLLSIYTNVQFSTVVPARIENTELEDVSTIKSILLFAAGLMKMESVTNTDIKAAFVITAKAPLEHYANMTLAEMGANENDLLHLYYYEIV